MPDILVAEDDPAIREGLAATLESDGHTVRLAADGAAALALVAQKRPDLLLLDVMMPRKSGWDVCAELRRSDPSLPIVFLTARGEEGDKVLGLDLGADDYIVKPFAVRELLARVRSALRRAAAPSAADAAAGPDFDFAGARVLAAALAVRAPDGTVSPISPRERTLLRLFASHPKIYSIGIGKDDILYQTNVDLRRFLDEKGYTYEYYESLGGHVWANWRIYLSMFAEKLFK